MRHRTESTLLSGQKTTHEVINLQANGNQAGTECHSPCFPRPSNGENWLRQYENPRAVSHIVLILCDRRFILSYCIRDTSEMIWEGSENEPIFEQIDLGSFRFYAITELKLVLCLNIFYIFFDSPERAIARARRDCITPPS